MPRCATGRAANTSISRAISLSSRWPGWCGAGWGANCQRWPGAGLSRRRRQGDEGPATGSSRSTLEKPVVPRFLFPGNPLPVLLAWLPTGGKSWWRRRICALTPLEGQLHLIFWKNNGDDPDKDQEMDVVGADS